MILPSFLSSGNLVLVVAPAFSANKEEVLGAISKLKKEGFRVETGRNAFSEWGKFAGTDTQRLEDVQWALNHPGAKAIFCTRGGYGLSRIISEINFDVFKSDPKWVIGFSDITLLHLCIQQMGIASLHGPMAVHLSREEQKPANDLEIKILKGECPSFFYPVKLENYASHLHVKARLLGGNLTMVSHHIGLYPQGFFDGAVLFLEEIGEYFYRIDRMLEQLEQNGVFRSLSAVVLGQFKSCESDSFPLTISQMIIEKTKGKIPVFSGLESGHGVPTFPLILGHEMMLEKSGDTWNAFQKLTSSISLAQEI